MAGSDEETLPGALQCILNEFLYLYFSSTKKLLSLDVSCCMDDAWGGHERGKNFKGKGLGGSPSANFTSCSYF